MSKFPSADFKPAEPIEPGNITHAVKEATGKVAKDATEAASVILPLDQIEVFPDLQIRVSGKAWQARVDEMAADMKRRGFDPAKPLIVFTLAEKADGKSVEMIYVEDGHTRLAAAAKAGVTEVPVIFRPKGWTPMDATKHMIQDNSGEPLSPWEQSIAVARMKGNGTDEAEIANILGKTKRYVQDLMVLSTASPFIRNAVLKGEVAASVAVREIRASGMDKAEDAIRKAIAGGGKATPTKLKGKEKKTGKTRKASAANGEGEGDDAEEEAKKGPPAGAPSDLAFWRAALVYASEHAKPAEGMRWAKAFVNGDKKAAEELEKYMGQPAGSFFDPSMRIAEESEDSEDDDLQDL